MADHPASAACAQPPPRRNCSSRSRTAGSSRSRTRLAPGSVCETRSNSARNVLDESLRTSCPETPRTAASEETRQTTSCWRCSADESLEQRVRVRGESDGERPDLAVGPGAVEDDDSPRPAQADKAREQVDHLVRVAESARVQNVVTVEQIERRVSQARSLLPASLAERLEQRHRRSDADVERLDWPGKRDPHRPVARAPDQRAHALCLPSRRRAATPPARSVSQMVRSPSAAAAYAHNAGPFTSAT